MRGSFPFCADVLLSSGLKCVIIKLGSRGCYIKSREMNIETYISAVKVNVVVDTTGAGDALVSGFISGIFDGLSVIDCAKRGCLAASLAIQLIGANGAITSKEQLLSL